jgi:putative ABC transport system substrate-binding protein
MSRRDFITLLGGAAAAWPLAARGQQAERIHRIGVLMNIAEDDQEGPARIAALLQGLQSLGWTVGRNLQLDVHWAAADAELFRKYATELVAAAPDVILASTSSAVAPLRQATRTVPVVFVLTVDPVGAGFVASLARPGSNATGFLLYEYSISAKWLELLKEIAPGVTRVAVLRDPATAAGIGQFAVIQAAAPARGVEVSPVDVRDVAEIERAISELARASNGGLIVTGSPAQAVHRKLILAAGEHRLPAVYPFHYMATDGGLMAYGPEMIDQFRRAAGYVDRILKGEKPANLPVQAPTKYDLVITSRPRRHLASKSRQRCSPAPTRSSSEKARARPERRSQVGWNSFSRTPSRPFSSIRVPYTASGS